MAKSTKHQDKIGSFENFRAPWETESGAEVDVDKPTLKRLLFNLKVGEAKAQDAQEDAKVAATEAEAERDEAKAQAADGSGAEAQKTIDKLTKERDAAQAKVEKFEKDQEIADLRKEVLGDFAEKNPKAAKYVKGETQEELEASLAEVKEDWGISDEADEDAEDADDNADDTVVRTRPLSRSLLNPADRANGQGGQQEVDFDKVASDVLAGGRVFG